eukprot:gene265-274_t
MHSTSGARQYCVNKEDASGPTNVDAVVAANEDEAKAIMDCISCMLDYKCPWAEGNEALKRVPSVLGTTPASLCPTPLPRGKVGDSLLSPRVVVIPAGEMLRFDSDNNDISAAHVYIVVSGRVSLGTSADCPSKADSSSGDGLSSLVQELQSLRTDSRKDVILGPGDVFGLLSIVSGSGAQPLHDSVVASAVDSYCRVLAVPLATIEKHMRKRPECYLRVGELVLRSFPESVRFIDRFGSLLLVPAGELYSVRDSGDVAVLLSGRAQVLSNETSSIGISYSVASGHVCREGAVLCNYSPRGRHTPTSINSREEAQTLNFRCIRESLLFRIPGDAIRMLLPQFPALACTLVRSTVSPTTQGHGIPESSPTAMKAIAVVPISGSVPLTQFDSLLCAWMNEHGIAAVTVSSSRMKGELGDVLEDASEEEYALVVGSWLRRFKRDCSVLFLQCDWTQNHLWNVRLHSNDGSFDSNNKQSDFGRLARILTGTAVGVVLGGGGARGLCHFGVLQALEESGIPVDIIGGTSIGAFIGALYASNENSVAIEPDIQRLAEGMGSLWSYIQGSFSCFYAYIRASMTLANFLPPVCDVDKDATPPRCHYLVDGGYVNNLPADIMKTRYGAGLVIAVDVSGDWAMRADHVYEDGLSGVTVLLNALNPFAKATR